MRTARLERRRMAEDATAHNDTFTYESNQDIYEQRKLRRDYRALLASAQSMYLSSLMKDTRRQVPESSLDDLGQMVRIGDTLYSKGM